MILCDHLWVQKVPLMGKGLKCSPTANSSRRAVSPTDTPEIALPSIMPATGEQNVFGAEGRL